jgi:hypothetical protein
MKLGELGSFRHPFAIEDVRWLEWGLASFGERSSAVFYKSPVPRINQSQYFRRKAGRRELTRTYQTLTVAVMSN